MRRRPVIPALLAAAALLAACSKRDDPCSADNQKAATADLVSSWYLFPDLLPQNVDLGAYQGPADLLDALTANARAQGKDRYWSYTTTIDAQQAFFAEGTFVGFGVSILVRGSQVFVSQVYAGSAAAAAGFLRGDEIVAIGSADPLTPVSTLVAADAACEASTPNLPCNSLGDAFGPATLGLQRAFDVNPLGASGPPVRRTVIKTTYNLDPVPTPAVAPPGTTVTANGAVIVDRSTLSPPLPPAGYLPLRTFISPADARLAAVIADFQAAGVTDVVVDLRYDGGGLLTTAETLLNLLGGNLAGDKMFALGYNGGHQSSNFIDYFVPGSTSIAPAHLAFLVTGASASASELVANAMAAWGPVALVGHQTYGKPVGQVSFVSSQCGLVVYLISFQISNAKGYGGYFGGLPASGFAGCGIAADDDLTHETWDPAETQTAAALQWLAAQNAPSPPACPVLSGPLSVGAAASASPPDVYPQAAHPAEAQRHVRGLF